MRLPVFAALGFVVCGLLAGSVVARGVAAGHTPAVVAGPARAASSAGTAGDRTYVGRVSGSQAYIGLSFKGSQLIAYVCDGHGKRVRRATITEWFRGTVHGQTISLRSRKGARLTGRVQGSRVTGQVHLHDGRTLSFSATPPRGKARFLIATQPYTRSGRLVHGWIRLANGSERGTPCIDPHCCIKAIEVANAIQHAQEVPTENNIRTAAFTLRNFARECVPNAG